MRKLETKSFEIKAVNFNDQTKEMIIDVTPEIVE